jgi:hypothetical protein
MTAAIDVFANLATTTITSGGTTAPAAGTVETWTAASSASFPTASTGASPPTQFRVVDQAAPGEVMLVTNQTGSGSNTWTVTRGVEGTTPIAHGANWVAQGIVTAGGLDSRYGALFGLALEDFLYQVQWAQMTAPSAAVNMNGQTHSNYLTPDGVYGDGSDGAVTFDGTTTIAGFSAPIANTYFAQRDTFFTNVTINNGVTIFLNSFRFFVNGTLTGIGTAAIGVGGVLNAAVATSTVAGCQGGAAPTTGNGAASAQLTSSLGGASGAGGAGSGHTGGAAVTPTAPSAVSGSVRALPWAVLGGFLSASVGFTPVTGGQAGGTGGGDGTNSGAAAGFGGGVCVVVAKIIAGSLTVAAFGGTGNSATAGNTGGGGGGGGGVVIIVSNTPAVPTVNVSGGSGGAGHGTGAAGSAGSAGTAILVPC